VDTDEPAGRSGAVPFAQVVEHRAGLVLGEVGIEQRGALTLGEAVFAGPAIEQTDVVLLAEAAAGGEVPGIAAAVESAVGVLAAKACEVVHKSERAGRCRRVAFRRGK
jgi:hypothetical protein